MKKKFWLIGNLYGKLFGWRLLAPVHHAIANLSMHALGYGNLHFNGSGEKWFIETILAPTDPKVVIDVGANVGDYSNLLHANTQAAIIAIEPNPHAFERLQSLPERVTKVHSAVGAAPGEAQLHFASKYDERASLVPTRTKGETTSVKVNSLTGIVKELSLTSVDFVKIDTEGYEKEVLIGMQGVRPAYIQFEFNINHLHRHITLHELAGLLPEYEFYRLLPNGWLPVNPKKYLDNIFMFSNYIAVKKT